MTVRALEHNREAFLSRNNAEAYARRSGFKIKRPLRYKRLLRKYPREATLLYYIHLSIVGPLKPFTHRNHA